MDDKNEYQFTQAEYSPEGSDSDSVEKIEDSRVKDNLVPFERVTTITSLPFEIDTLKSFTGNQIQQALDNAVFLRTKGFLPLAAAPKSKNLKKVSSTDSSFDKQNFVPGVNIAIKLGPERNEKLGLDSEFATVDLDLEVEEARLFAYHFLKGISTATYGRRSAVRSHYLFRVRSKEIGSKKNMFEWPAGMRSRNKDDQESALILEVKPSGASLVPPSTHPSGEKLFWMVEDINPVILPYRDIYRMAGKIAAGAIFLRSWANGVRDNIVVSTAGWLLKEGWSYQEVAEFLNTLFACAWPIDQIDIRRWRIRVQTLAKEIEKARQMGDLTEMDSAEIVSANK